MREYQIEKHRLQSRIFFDNWQKWESQYRKKLNFEFEKTKKEIDNQLILLPEAKELKQVLEVMWNQPAVSISVLARVLALSKAKIQLMLVTLLERNLIESKKTKRSNDVNIFISPQIVEFYKHADGVDKFYFSYGSDYTKVTNPLGQESTYSYQIIGNRKKLVSVDRAAGTSCPAATRSKTYDVYGYVDNAVDWKGNITDFDYNASGQLQQKTLAAGTNQATTMQYTWIAGENKISKRMTQESEVSYDYYPNGRTKSIQVKNLSTNGTSNEIVAVRIAIV